MNHHLDQEVVAGFISEAKGYLPEIMLGLESFAADATQQHGLREAFRFAHIIKGAASMLGFMQISEVAYQLEVTLEMLCEERLSLSQELLEDLCQDVSDLADLLDRIFANAPTNAPVFEDSSINEPPTEKLSTNELSITESSIPELLAPDASDQGASLDKLSTPELSVTPTDYEEKGETILLSSTEAEDDLLPEAKTSLSALTVAQLEELETEEPLVSLLDEASFSVSLPKVTNAITIGDVDVTEVAKELKESYGDYPPLPQPEFTIPNELMAGLPELQFTPDLDAPTAEALPVSKTQIKEQAEVPPKVSSEVVEFSEPTNAANFVSDHLTDEVVQGVMQTSEPTMTEDALPEPTFAENWTPPAPDFETAKIPAPTFDETLPDVLAMPSLLELSRPTYFDQQLAEQMPEEISKTVSTPAVSIPLSMSDPAISDEMARELMETFLLEAEEHLQNLHTSLRVLYKNPNNRELIQEVRRSSHSLKGTAAMVGLDNIMQLAHRMEDVLDLIYDGEMALTQDRTLLLMQATDALEDMSNGQSKTGEVQRLYSEFARLLSDSSSTATETLETTAYETAPTVEKVAINADESILEISTAIESERVASPEDAVLEIVETPTAPTVTDFTSDAEAESQIPEPSFENFAKAVKEPVVEVTSEASVPMVAEPMIERTPFVAPPTVTETTSAPAPKTQTVETVATPADANTTTVHEPEVLPATPAGAMAQASSQFVRVPIERLDDVVKLISEMIITRTMFEQRLADFARQVEELRITGTRLRRASSNLESKYEASTLGGGRPAIMPNNMPARLSATAALAATGLVNSLVTHNTHGFDDLEFDRYTEFHLVSRELVESSTDIQTLGRELNHLNGDFLSYLNRQGRIYSELQDRLMRLRMVPLSSIAPRLHRTVRTVGVQQHKEVELILEGETTAVDTTALMEMTDPLLHLLRNAVDHGIESPEARVAKGKPAQGKIVMRAFYEGSQVVLQLRDDGQGLNADKIRNRAIQHGMISAAEAESMSLNELWSLIFTPGFSTADQISEISGRGVGMDVVHTTVQKLKGTITIDSQLDAGTIFTIRLPLTLAVTRSLMVKGNGQTFAIPLDVVTQIMRLEMSKVERIGQEPVIRLGGKVYPLLMLSRLLNMRQTTDEIPPRPPALMLSVEGKEVVVIVDQLMGGREIVIKTLGNHLRKIHGVMGATLMGDGEVVLILNLAELLRGTVRVMPRRLAINTPVASDAAVETSEAPQSAMMVEPVAPSAAKPVAPATAPPKPKTMKQTLTIMIVDDSPSVRRVSSNMIKNIGWLPVLAKDGLDALEQLQASETPPDLILLDIEMPRMDGYQFLGSVRSLPAYRNLPVVIVSSRSSEKHRQKAFDLGATEYLVKPYQEDNVISLIRRLVQEGHQ